jgi:hypothetical protein
MKYYNGHTLYVTEDPDAPESIKDRHGEVVLGLCRVCKAGESELQEHCKSRMEKRGLDSTPLHPAMN